MAKGKEVFATKREKKQANEIKNLKAETLDLKRELEDKSFQLKVAEDENGRLSSSVINLESSVSALTRDLGVARADLKLSKDNSAQSFQLTMKLDEKLKDMTLDSQALKRVLEMYVAERK